MPESFDDPMKDLAPMQRAQPDYSADDLAKITVPVVIALGERDEFIERDHVENIARGIPQAECLILDAVSHFAPLQRSEVFNKPFSRS